MHFTCHLHWGKIRWIRSSSSFMCLHLYTFILECFNCRSLLLLKMYYCATYPRYNCHIKYHSYDIYIHTHLLSRLVATNQCICMFCLLYSSMASCLKTLRGEFHLRQFGFGGIQKERFTASQVPQLVALSYQAFACMAQGREDKIVEMKCMSSVVIIFLHTVFTRSICTLDSCFLNKHAKVSGSLIYRF